MNDEGKVYERTILKDGTVSVPEEHAAMVACVIEQSSKAVLTYKQVQRDGTINLSEKLYGVDVLVVIPSDEAMEKHR